MSLVLNRPPAPVPVPHLKAVKDLIEGLTGKDVEIASGAEPVAIGGATGSVSGLYVDDKMDTRALVMFDLPLAAYSGAALGLIPPGAAQDAVESGVLDETLLENCGEVLNIFASLFNLPNAPHLKLYAVIGPDDELRMDVRELAARTAPRDDISLEIARYGKGRLSVVVR